MCHVLQCSISTAKTHLLVMHWIHDTRFGTLPASSASPCVSEALGLTAGHAELAGKLDQACLTGESL